MKINLFIILFGLQCYSQIDLDNIKETDTIWTKYYKNGKIKHFTLKKQTLTARYGEKMKIYLDSTCDNQIKQRIVKNETYDRSNWNNTINHFHDSISILHRDFWRGIYNGNKDFEVIISSKDCPQLSITVSIDKDSLVKRLLVSKNMLKSYSTEKYYTDLYFDSVSLTKNFDYVIEDKNYLTVAFYEKSFIKHIYFNYQNNGSIKIKSIRFYKGNMIKEYGHYNMNNSRIGKWYNYYTNGKISSEGEYSGSEFDSNGNEINIKKTGKWIYYAKQGCIEKEEVWDKGVLISPAPIIKKTKHKKKATH